MAACNCVTEAAPAPTARGTPPLLALALLLGIALFNYADRYLMTGLVPLIQEQFAIGDAYMGLLMGPAFAILYTTLGVPLGVLADRTTRIGVICGGCILWSICTALSGFAQSEEALALARIGV